MTIDATTAQKGEREEALVPCPFCGAAAREFMWPGHAGCSDKKCGAFAANMPIAQWNARALLSSSASEGEMREALADALSGWRYIRKMHGDLPGVGWDRVENALSAALKEPK
jgi:hypothetical protein